FITSRSIHVHSAQPAGAVSGDQCHGPADHCHGEYADPPVHGTALSDRQQPHDPPRHLHCPAAAGQRQLDALARLETLLPPLARREHWTLSLRRSNALEERPSALPYNVFVTAAQRPELIAELCTFFQHLEID